jgi:DNA-binding transcriptional ArsR family regulator
VITYQDALVGLADPTRRSIFERLGSGPRAVVDLAQGLPVSRPAVSQHLRVLKAAGLVSDRRVGNRRIYQLNPDGLGALRTYLDRFWDRALADFKAVAESEQSDQNEQGEGA